MTHSISIANLDRPVEEKIEDTIDCFLTRCTDYALHAKPASTRHSSRAVKTVGKHSLLGLALAATENKRLRDNPEQTELLVFYTAFYDAIEFIEYL